MKKTRKSFVLTQEVKDKIFTFYNTNSRNSIHTKEMILMDVQRAAVKYLEHTLSTLFKRFQTQHPGVKISQNSFERMRPKNIKLRSLAKQQVRDLRLTICLSDTLPPHPKDKNLMAPTGVIPIK